MVNSKNVAVSMVVLIGVGTIAAYMSANGLNTTDISFSKACWDANADVNYGAGNLNATCDMIDDSGIEWDTKIPCLQGFKPEKYYFTYRQIFGLQDLGRSTKGTEIKKNMQMGEVNGVAGAEEFCATLVEDEDYEEFRSDVDAWAEKNKADRELFAWKGYWVPFTNYKACSLNILFLCGGSDSAECADGPCAGGYNGRDLGARWKLNGGCNRHDRCLEGYDNIKKSAGYCCDKKLKSAANTCKWFGGGWKWVNCGWRGCDRDCKDNRFVGLLTSIAMPHAGHDGGCSTSGGKHYWP